MSQAKNKQLFVILGLFVALGIVGTIVTLVIVKGDTGAKNDADQLSGSSSGNFDPALDTESPSNQPTTSVQPSSLPSDLPSFVPSYYPSVIPSSSPSMRPSIEPSMAPSIKPTTSLLPSYSIEPSTAPTTSPSTSFPSVEPSLSSAPTEWQETIVYAIADVPYNDRENNAFPGYVRSIPADADFAIHLGDIKNAQSSCSQARFQDVANVLSNSAPPMFIVVGDNEWNDCSDPGAALNNWRNVFNNFDERHWNHNLNVTRGPRPETFAFVRKKTLFIGVNVPGSLRTCCDWNNMLTAQGNWAVSLMTRHTNGDPAYDQVNGIVLMGHANPTGAHRWFFDPITAFVANTLRPRNIPMLYLCADSHTWLHEPNYQGQPNYLRIRVTGGVGEPPLKLTINPTAYASTQDAFQYDRFW